MPTAFLTRVVRFSAAHRYYRPEWSDEKNRATFGACANEHGHGHNYSLEVMVAGVPDRDTGFSVNLGELDRILQQHVVEPLDHRHVNHAIPEFGDGGKIPTTENLVMWIWERLEPQIRDARLVRLRLRENDELWVDYFGPGQPAEGPRPELREV